jgi:GNAT superfamily N-acetyltransferase
VTSVRRLGVEAWATLRGVRLDALREAPGSFGPSLDEEAALDEAAWRQRLGEQPWFAAFDGARAVGVAAGGQLREPDPDVRTLRGLWVAPPHRGDGTAGALVDAVVRWARDDGATTLSLWATESSVRARAFYARYGFVPTGDVAELDRPGHPRMERYTLAL